MSTGKVALFGPWIGEFGWELMTWQAWCREKAHEYEKSYVCSFPGMEPLYADFAEFIPHDHEGRALDWQKEENIEKARFERPDDVTDQYLPPKNYRHTSGEWMKFGGIGEADKFKLLIHARGIGRGGKDYPVKKWENLVQCLASNLTDNDLSKIASVGTMADHHIEGTHDLRDIGLDNLMWHMAGVDCVVGQSSGVMHLASLCGAPHVVWGDSRVQFGGETLDKRYGDTWNPFKTPYQFIYSDNWQPEWSDIAVAVRDMKESVAMKKQKPQRRKRRSSGQSTMQLKEAALPSELRTKLADAARSTGFLITVCTRKNKSVDTYWIIRNFERDDLVPSLEHILDEIIEEHVPDLQEGAPVPQKVGVESWE